MAEKEIEEFWKARLLRNSAILAQTAVGLNGGDSAEAVANLMMAAIMVVIPVKKMEVTDDMIKEGLRKSLGHAESLLPLIKEFMEWMQLEQAKNESGEATIQ
jgi:hypothetical protein